MKRVQIYTDGACSGNPGPGGWGAILIFNGHEKEISGFEPETTNNRMEITAVIEGLKCLKEPCSVEIFSDSAYVINALDKGWIKGWEAAGWKRDRNKDVANTDLWKELLALSAAHRINWVKVKGHADNEYNNRCDKLATDSIKNNS